MQGFPSTPEIPWRGWDKEIRDVWEGGLSAVREAAHPTPRLRAGGRKQHVLITGGAGFIGTNLADRLSSGRSFLVYDDLSRAGAEGNLGWRRGKNGENLRVEIADVRDAHSLRNAVRSAEQISHFAAQVAVTTRLTDPRQYVLDYARTFVLLAVVFLMSCIYGFHQMGTEDQGWVAHFLIRTLERNPIVLYGDGMLQHVQVQGGNRMGAQGQCPSSRRAAISMAAPIARTCFAAPGIDSRRFPCGIHSLIRRGALKAVSISGAGNLTCLWNTAIPRFRSSRLATKYRSLTDS